MWGDMGSMGWGWGSGWGLLGAAHMLLWWILLILGITVLAKWLFGAGTRDGGAGGGNALDILKERYARGEIGRDEFEQKRRDLGG